MSELPSGERQLLLVKKRHDLIAEVLVEGLFHHHGVSRALDFHNLGSGGKLGLQGMEQTLVDVRISVAGDDERGNLQLFREMSRLEGSDTRSRRPPLGLLLPS